MLRAQLLNLNDWIDMTALKIILMLMVFVVFGPIAAIGGVMEKLSVSVIDWAMNL